MTSSPFFDNICTLPLSTDLFAQALHPTRPLLAVALASGHVQTYRLPSTDADEDSPPPLQPIPSHTNGNGSGILSQRRRSSTASENGLGSIDTVWKTRRHKGSARTISYAPDGNACYSGGTDGLVKAFDCETGRVVSKIALPFNSEGQEDAPTVVHALTPLNLVIATDSGCMHLYDVRAPQTGQVNISSKSAQTFKPHGVEHVNALVPIPASETSTSGFPKQFVTVGGSTLSVTDIRKGIIATSEDQEVELSSVTIVSGLKKGGTSVGEKVLVGQSDGVISLWERGVWGDLDDRITVDRVDFGASVDTLCEIPDTFLPKMGKLKMGEKVVAAGLDDGRVRFVRIGRNAVVSEWDLKHDEIEGCVGIDFDIAGERMVTGGGQAVKVWTRASAAAEAAATATAMVNGSVKRKLEVDSDDEDDDEIEDSEDEGAGDVVADEDSDDESEEEKVKKRKKRKRNKGKDKTGGKALSLSGTF